ncbi:TetR/AcrR family transcriptional regulator [Hoeflea alexandrii]|uniref:TetR/AcrR family transcriptional regulator n=1 Tax=Hoeflea alexandrii TaxID=288436 RepID=UPI0035CFD57A
MMEVTEMSTATTNKPRVRRTGRNADQAKADLLSSAKREFATKGLALAGIEGIAEPTGLNKKMIYHYFGSKEDLYVAVLEQAYMGIRKMEEALPLEDLEPLAAIRRLVESTWDYYVANPEFIALVNQENLLGAVYLKKSGIVKRRTSVLLKRVKAILKKGIEQGKIRPGIDPLQLNHSVAGLGFYYLNNRFTNSQIYNFDHMTQKALSKRRAFIVDFVMRAVMSKEEIARCEQ